MRLRGIAVDPGCQHPAGPSQIAGRQRQLDLGEGVAELTKTDGQVQHRHMQAEHRDRVQPLREPLERHHQCAQRADDQRPSEHAVLAFAGIGRPVHRLGRPGDRVMNEVALGQGPALLDQQRKDQGDEGHRISTARRMPA